MAKVLTLEQAGKLLIYMLVSVVLLFMGPQFAERLILAPQASATMRWVGIAISVVSVLPWLGYVAWGLTVADEYHRQILLIGTAIAFGLAVLFSMTMQLMVDARLADQVITISLPIGFVIWFVGLGASALVYRLRGAG